MKNTRLCNELTYKELLLIISNNEDGLHHFYAFLDNYKNGGRKAVDKEDAVNYVRENGWCDDI